jgi:hypothetical protein
VSTTPGQNKRTIIERLKYGEDQKTTAQLRTSDGCFCFQGIIVDEHLKDTGGEWIDGFAIISPDTGREVSAWIPNTIRDWSGFTDKELCRYTSLNDDEELDLTLAQLGRIIDNDTAWGE